MHSVGGLDPVYWSATNTRGFLRGDRRTNPKLLSAVRERKLDGARVLGLAIADLDEFGINSEDEQEETLLHIAKLKCLHTDNVLELPEIAPLSRTFNPYSPSTAFTYRPRKPSYGAPSRHHRAKVTSLAGSTAVASTATATPSAPPRRNKNTKADATKMDDRTLGIVHQRCREASIIEIADQAEKDREELLMKGLTSRQRQLRAAFEFCYPDQETIEEDELDLLLQFVYPKVGLKRIVEMRKAILLENDAEEDGELTIDHFTYSEYANGLRVAEADLPQRATRRDLLDNAFKLVDKDGNGTISHQELQEVLPQVFPTVGPKGLQEYFFAILEECDVNRDGVISQEEFLQSEVANLLSRPAELESMRKKREMGLKSSFFEVDINGDGLIDYSELLLLLTKVLPGHDEESYERYREVIISECDTDKNGSIDLQEFLQSSYANLLAGVEEDEFISEGNVHLVAHVTKTQRDRMRKTSYRLLKGKEVQLQREMPEKSRETVSTKRFAYDSAPKHLNTMQQEKERIQEQKVRQAQAIITSMHGGAISGRFQGIIETERRFTAITDLFNRWDHYNIGTSTATSLNPVSSEGYIDSTQLWPVLQKFFGWTEEELQDNYGVLMAKIDENGDGQMEWKEFVNFIVSATRDVQAAHFDNLIKYIHECIGAVTEEGEHSRRDKALKDLFDYWDWDRLYYILQSDFIAIKQHFNSNFTKATRRRHYSVSFPASVMSRFPQTTDKKIDCHEFMENLQKHGFLMLPYEFDLMVYHLKRSMELVQVSTGNKYPSNTTSLLFGKKRPQMLKHRLALETHLATTVLKECVKEATAWNPLIIYGNQCDPSRAIEKLASIHEAIIKPCVISARRAIKNALDSIRTDGWHSGAWIYCVLTETFLPDDFLRQLGVMMKTATKSVKPSFKLIAYAPYKSIEVWPRIILQSCISCNLDAIKVPDDDAGKKAHTVTPRKATTVAFV